MILPLGCSQSLYEMARQNCAHVFPNYDLRFRYPGKTGQIELFETYAIDHPDTIVVNAFSGMNIGALDLKAIGYPMVLKRDWGGEGYTVYWIEDRQELAENLKTIQQQSSDPEKLLLQQAILGNQGRVMRVVCIGDFFKAYWRIAPEPDERIVHLTDNGCIDADKLDPPLLMEAENAARQFCAKTGINLVGIDYLFDFSSSVPKSFIIELNYFFGRKGLGGSQAYYTILTREIQKWCQRTLG